MWNPHQTLTLKFGERFLHGIFTKLQHQSLVKGSYVETPGNFGIKVS